MQQIEQPAVSAETNPNEAPKEEPTIVGDEPSLADYATRAYRDLIPKFKGEIDKLSGVQCKRVLIALMEFPFEKQKFDWPYEQAEKIFNMGIDIMDCRFVLTRAAIELTLEQKKAILEEAKKAEEGEQDGRSI